MGADLRDIKQVPTQKFKTNTWKLQSCTNRTDAPPNPHASTTTSTTIIITTTFTTTTTTTTVLFTVTPICALVLLLLFLLKTYNLLLLLLPPKMSILLFLRNLPILMLCKFICLSLSQFEFLNALILTRKR